MGKFYTDEQIQEVIDALEKNSPGIWNKMKAIASAPEPITEEQKEGQEIAWAALSRVFDIVIPELPFIVEADDKQMARHKLDRDIGRALRAAVESTK